jgi:hypothetical protein
MAKGNEGWAMPGNAKKFHFYVNGISLCGRWMFLAPDLESDFPSGKRSPDECKPCWDRRQKRLRKVSSDDERKDG